VTELFTLEWSGGVAEHHFRNARPGMDDFAWGSLDASRYPASLVAAAREVWTGVAMSEYAAIVQFAEVVGALTLARAPLDLIGMTSDFLADEVRHVELASRLLMQLGGAAPRPFEPARLSLPVTPGLTPLQRASELALRVGCIAEVFAGGTAAPMMRETTHPLVRAVYESILRDEARHQRFGSLYFEWAGERLDDAERARLGFVAVDALGVYAPLWRHPGIDGAATQGWRNEDIHELGWIEPDRYTALARSVAEHEILPLLRRLGVVLPEEQVAALLA
jgi:hypothetical protein